jgi:hypothetical protein
MIIRRVPRWIADATAQLDRVMLTCADFLGRAYLDGMAAYAQAMHGPPPDCGRDRCSGEHAEEPITSQDPRADIGPKRKPQMYPRSQVLPGRDTGL